MQPSLNTIPAKNRSLIRECRKSSKDIVDPLNSHTPHSVKRKKYSKGELSTQCVQCNKPICDQSIKPTQKYIRVKNIQCDIDPPDGSDGTPVCSECRCTPGFCTYGCVSCSKMVNKSDTVLKEGIESTPKRRCSVPRFNRGSNPIVNRASPYKCSGKCSSDCRNTMTTSEVSAITDSTNNDVAKSEMRNTLAASPCVTQKRITTSNPILADPINPITVISTICVECQCSGACNIQCLVQKESLHGLITAEELNAPQIVETICVACNCTTECNPLCTKDKNKFTQKVCQECKCIGICTDECMEQKKELETIDRETCDCETMCKAVCDKFKSPRYPNKDGAPAVPKISNEDVACQLCACVGACIQACELLKAASNPNQSNLICDPCACPNLCTTECQAAKEVAEKICDECVCNATCTPKCDEHKRQKASPPKICEDCKCCGTCIPECEENRAAKRNAAKKEIRISTVSQKSGTKSVSIPSEAVASKLIGEEDSHTQVKGIIENFNDENITQNISNVPIRSEDKNRSSCNVAGEAVCETCICTEECGAKCMSTRKTKSISDFPPKDTVCEVCRCAYSCSKTCELAKAEKVATLNDNGGCIRASGMPIKCDEEDADWVPCSNCIDGEPCSPECRERRAISFNMPEPPGTSCGRSQSQPQEVISCAKPEIISCATLAQTIPPPISCGEVQTADDMKNVTIATSTPNANIRETSLKDQKASVSCGTPTPPCTQGDQPPPCGSQPPCLPQAEPECNMCHKLGALVSSLFRQDAADPGGNPNRSMSQGDSSPQRQCASTLNEKTGGCQCNNIHPSNSYADKMKQILGQLRTSCDDAEAFASPYIKAASAFDLDVHNQQEAIVALLQKCQQKDNCIEALLQDLLRRSQSRAFDGLLQRLQEPCCTSPDFDKVLIANTLNKTQECRMVCGIDLHNFKINSVKRIGATNLLMQWSPPDDPRVDGYEIVVNGLLKMSVTPKERVYAVLDALNFSSTISIEVYAMVHGGRAYPSAVGFYAKY